MTKAAHRFYRDDDVFRNLIQHCAKPTLVRVMMIEKKGTIFDFCVKELYREVHFEAIKDMVRDTPRKAQYLDAVIQVKAEPARGRLSEFDFPTSGRANNPEPCSPNAIGNLRLKCPNLRVVTRHNAGQSEARFTIILQKGKHTGTVRFHEHLDIVPTIYNRHVETPETVMPALWLGWIIKHTVGLTLLGAGGLTPQMNNDLKTLLMDKDRLDGRITELQTGWLPFTLSELSEIVTSRPANKNPISRISSTVEPFTLDQLRQFIMMAGKNLYQLHLHTQPHPSKITPGDLPSIVKLVRTQCPKLVDLRLPMTFTLGGVRFTDQDIDLPPYDIASGPGTVRKLTILGYKFDSSSHDGLKKLCHWNFARNLACLLAPDFEIPINEGPVTKPLGSTYGQSGLASLSWFGIRHDLIKAIKFFQSLGPILEPHFATPSLDHLGLETFGQLNELRYSQSGKPHVIMPKQTWSSGTKRAWEDYRDDDDPYDPYDYKSYNERYGSDDDEDRAGGCGQQ